MTNDKYLLASVAFQLGTAVTTGTSQRQMNKFYNDETLRVIFIIVSWKNKTISQ